MSWTIVITGQPVSGNHANKIGRGYRRGGIEYPKMVKTDEALAYQQGVALLVRLAKPRHWNWEHRPPGERYIVCEYRFWISRDADCTNMIKVLEDAIFPALGINDSWALPRAMSKEIVKRGQERVEVTIT